MGRNPRPDPGAGRSRRTLGGERPGLRLQGAICSKIDLTFPPQIGTLKRLNDDYLVIVTGAGEMQFSRNDFRDDHANSAAAGETKADAASLDRFRKVLARSRRLSITFRFELGKDELGTKARQDIGRLARYLKSTGLRSGVVLAGFGDDIGGAAATLRIAGGRAEAVRRELLRILPEADVRAVGFGMILPVACNDGELGRSKNRRVEVFLTP
jgi:outer membrane protein OmpA-like peptidoglycan-associated protein